ncbi:hypothetical protein HF883_07520 [Cloacibacillus porcorum]|uniref:hypothetical protein n=1 Tax=Cloacibacillus porcorum TaxID=1197717 RepID=UPI0014593FE9|nr:hypothetical protein [Cloacibacillus porcorum]MDY5390946.1 hypothetical protein [Cloacibacillus porcorum]NMF18074.1 hypothetical protein [Cloacibacillus porcorum]
MSRTKLFFYNSISTAILQIITFISGFIVPKYMLVYYGSEINGLISSILQFIAYFNLVEAGISGAAVYALYRPLANADHSAISSIVSAAKKYYYQSGVIFVLLTVVLAMIYPLYIKSTGLSSLEITLLVLILGINGCLEFFTLAKYRALLTADQKTYVISIASIVYIILNTASVMFLAKTHVNIVLLRAIVVLTIFSRTIILIYYCRTRYRYINYSSPFSPSLLDKRWDALILQILGVIHVGAPVVILTLILKDLKLVSIYTIYNMVLGGIAGILGIFISGLAASFGDVVARRQLDTLQRSYQEFECFYYSMIAVAFSVTFVTIMPFISIYTKGITDVDYNVPLLGFLFTLNALMYNIKTPQGMLVISAGMYKETRLQTLTQGAIVVVGGILLAPSYGIEGVLYACIASNFYRDVDLLFFIPRNLTKLSVRLSFIRIVRLFFNIAVSVTILKFLFPRQVDTYGQWATWAAIATVISSIVILTSVFIFDRQNLLSIHNRIRHILGGSR